MREIELHQNELSGSLPVDIFHLENIERLAVQSNSLTGLIPTDFDNLQNAAFISLSHNSFKGRIPQEIKSLSKLEFLHLHNNLLTGIAPNMPWLREIGQMLGETNRYITDCGDPSYLLANPISCPSCTLYCNSDTLCQENKLMNATQALAPDWVDKRIQEVRETLSSPPFEIKKQYLRQWKII